MKQKLVLTATEARQNFFNLLKTASKGREIIIKNRNVLFRLRIEENGEENRKEKLKALKEMEKINLPTMSIEKMKKIISQTRKIHL